MNWLPALFRGCALLALAAALAGCFTRTGSEIDEQKDPHFLRGKSRATAMDYPGAIEAFENAVTANPRNASAHFELGVLNEKNVEDGHAAAIYHFSKHLKLRPDSPMADIARQRIANCKLELAKNVPVAIASQQIQREFDRLGTENSALRQQVEQLKMQLAQQAALLSATNAIGLQTPPTNSGVAAPANAATDRARPAASGNQPARPTPQARTHTIKSGDTLSSIARRYGVKLGDLTAANPGLNPKKLKPGQAVRIPPRS